MDVRMSRFMLKSKIHRARITAADLNYEGSLSLDPELMVAADVLPFEQVSVVNINTGARFETYAIPGEAGEVKLNGAAARLGQPGDLVIVMSYQTMTDAEAHGWQPLIVHVDANNHRIALAGSVAV
jgi:aspartate 1-decarboxylase